MVVGTPAPGERGRMAGEWVAEGGGGGRGEGGLHSSNGMREPLSNRCRGGARSPRWLLRTLMSFSLDPLPPPPPSPAAPVRPATHPTALASSSSTFDAAPRATRRYAAVAAVGAPSRSLTLIPQLLTAATVLLSPAAFLSFSPAPRERRP